MNALPVVLGNLVVVREFGPLNRQGSKRWSDDILSHSGTFQEHLIVMSEVIHRFHDKQAIFH